MNVPHCDVIRTYISYLVTTCHACLRVVGGCFNTCCSYTLAGWCRRIGGPVHPVACWHYCEYQHWAVISATLCFLFYCCPISYIICFTFRDALQVDIVGFHTSKCVELKTVTGWCCRAAVCRIVLCTCSVEYPVGIGYWVIGHPDVGLPQLPAVCTGELLIYCALTAFLLALRLVYLLTYCMVQSPSWAADWLAASQEITRISRNPKVHYRTHKRPPPVSFLCQPNPVHILEIHPNILHPSAPRSPQWSPYLRFPHQDPIHTPLLTHTRHMPSPSHSSPFYHPHNIGWGVQII